MRKSYVHIPPDNPMPTQSERELLPCDQINPDYASEVGKLPVMFIHGLNGRDQSICHSDKWGRIPSRFRDAGYSVWFGNQDSWNGVQHNAIQIAASIRQVIQLTGAPKIHLVAHSKGGVDARAALNRRGVADQVFSFTTLATPHMGTRFGSFLNSIPIIMPYVVVPCFNLYARLTGDPAPDSLQVMKDMTIKSGKEFDQEYPVPDSVIYRSYAFQDERPTFKLPHPGTMVMSLFDGRTDGVVPLHSTEQDNRVIVRVVGEQDITHDEPNDLHKRDILFVLPDGTSYPSAPDFLLSVINELNELYLESQR